MFRRSKSAAPPRLGRHATLFALATLSALAACRDAVSAPDTRTAHRPAARPDVAPLAAATAPTRSVLPTGKGGDVIDDPTPPPRTRYRIDYHDRAVMQDDAHVYLIWYGTWSADPATTILTDLVSNIGSSPYFSTVTLYPNLNGQRPSGVVYYAGSDVDPYFSHGPTLSDADIADVVRARLDAGRLPTDPAGIYVVLASPEVTASSGLGATYCAMHGTTTQNGTSVRFAFVGSPSRSPSRCAPQMVGPNATLNADAAASLLAAALFDTITDPNLDSWYDRLGLEGGDKCAWSYGATFAAPNGARANVRLGGRYYLLQQLWVPTKTGGACALRP